MHPSDPGSIPSNGGANWPELYAERAEARIAYVAARAAICETHGRLLLAHADVPTDLRHATVAQDEEYQWAVSSAQAAYARVVRAEAAIETQRAARLDLDVDGLRRRADGAISAMEQAATMIRKVAGSSLDR